MSDKKHRAPIPMPSESSYESDVVRSNSELHAATTKTSDYQPGTGMGAVVVHHLVTALLVAMALALGTWGYLTFKNASLFQRSDSRQSSPFEHHAVDAQVDRLHFALAVYHSLYEKHPADLEALVDEGLLFSSDLNYPPGSSTILYQRVGETYEITVERTVITTEPATPGDEIAPTEANPEAPQEVPEAPQKQAQP